MVFTVLGETGPAGDERLRALYGYPAGPVVRANVIASLDGGATTGGTSGGLGGSGDRRLFAVLRELADVIVVGAGTARVENYSGVRLTPEAMQRRRDTGRAEVPPIAVVTRSGEIERNLPVLASTEVPSLVLTSARVAERARERLGGLAEVIDCSAGDSAEVDLAVALNRLAERGLTRVLTEGGPTLLDAFLGRDLLDELCLTTAPVIVGGSAARVAAGPGDVLTRMRRAHVVADSEGYLYLRYTR